ncbi:MAG: PEGA domain-containing protein [Candidatus Saccharimonadales bacterium]
MDFLNPNKKRANHIKLLIGYVLIAIAVALVTLILVFQSYGYDLDRKTGAIIQNGLLYVAAQPEPADIYLNGKQYKSLSDAKLVLPSDVYKIELKHDGYSPWSRTVSLAGGTIERVVYPFLFPSKLSAKEQKVYTAAPSFSTQSPDRRWILVQQPGQIGVFDEFDANDSTKPATTVTVPTSLWTASKQHSLKTLEWSTDNRHFLVQHDYDGGSEFVVIDRESPDQSYSVNKTFAVNPTKVSLRDKNYDQLYLFDQPSGKLNVANFKNKTTTPLLTGVLDYKTHSADLVLYATNDKATAGKTRIMIRDDSGSYLLREVTASTTYLLNLAQYSDHWYMAAGASNENAVFVYKDPLSTVKQNDSHTLPITALRVNNPQWLEFSANTQFLALESGPQFAVYDFENQHSFKYDLQIPLDGAAPHASWMDGHRLILNSQGKMVVVDYDGINLQTLSANQAGLLPMFDRQYKLLYTMAPSSTVGSQALSRTNLIVGQNN